MTESCSHLLHSSTPAPPLMFPATGEGTPTLRTGISPALRGGPSPPAAPCTLPSANPDVWCRQNGAQTAHRQRRQCRQCTDSSRVPRNALRPLSDEPSGLRCSCDVRCCRVCRSCPPANAWGGAVISTPTRPRVCSAQSGA